MLRSARFLVTALALSALAACASPTLRLNANAATAGNVVLTVPEQVEIATINGIEPKGMQGLLSRGDRRLELAPGRYEILAYYREIWPVTDGHDTLMSDPALFVLDAQNGARYQLDYSRPDRYEDARKLAAGFQGWIADAQGQRTASTSSGLKFRRGLTGQDRTLIAATPEGSAQQYIAPQPPRPTAAVAAPAVTAPAAAANGAAAAAAPAKDWLPLMQAWWQQASADERRAFLSWIATQPQGR